MYYINGKDSFISNNNISYDSSIVLCFKDMNGFYVKSVFVNNIDFSNSYFVNDSLILKNIKEDLTVRIVYSKFIISIVTNVSNGMISKSVFLDYKSTYRITYQPNDDYTLNKILINNTLDTMASKDSLDGYTFYNVKSDKSISVIYTLKPVSIIILNNLNSNSQFKRANFNENYNYKFDSFNNYFIDSVFLNNSYVGSLHDISFITTLSFYTIRIIYKSIFPDISKQLFSENKMYCPLNIDSLSISLIAPNNGLYYIQSVAWYRSKTKNFNQIELLETFQYQSSMVTSVLGIHQPIDSTYYYFSIITNNSGNKITSNFSGSITIINTPDVSIELIDTPIQGYLNMVAQFVYQLNPIQNM